MTKRPNAFINPFERFTEKKLAIAGTLCLLAGAILFRWCRQTNDGVYHIAPKPDLTLTGALTEAICCTVLLTALLWVLGKFINIKTRVIDLANATLIHRIPLILGILMIQLPVVKTTTERILHATRNNTIQEITSRDLSIASLTGLLMLGLLVYSIVLLVNGFRTAVHAKKAVHYIGFAFALILAEVIYRSFIYPVLSRL
ncbi:hypothetical protein [Niabella beijingensis]|uniref:hypothetical protein n=1 Tax=Niabella beijingensis TaxID=2872700 RepID=UPI001CBCA487|nr:hypothetical protein [Niabella beijingensis]MBZ4190211.1 hypothetical protein [Niabella beijingensis]